KHYYRKVHRVQTSDFGGLTEDLDQDITERPLVREVILEFFSTLKFREGVLDLDISNTFQFQLGGIRRQAYWAHSLKVIASKADLANYWVRISFGGDFLGPAPSYTFIREPLRRLCHRLITFTISRRGQTPENVTTTDLFFLKSMDEGTVIGRHFGVITEQTLQTLTVEVLGPQRQQVRAAGGASQVDPEAPQDADVGQEGVQANPAPKQAPQMPQAAAPAPRTIS
ncbi:hypothetical protein Tco_1557729, partial [Tanacetum coccineum]